MTARLTRVGLIWTQFSPYHVDRCEAVAARLAGRAEVIAVEVATTSTTYAWSASGEVRGARKVTLFPDESWESVSLWRRLRAQFWALRRCDFVFVGISYGEPDVALLAFCLRSVGIRVVMMTESKFDDMQRRIHRELGKALLLSVYCGAIVGGLRQESYLRFLGYRRRPVLTGYDTVSLDRVRAQGGGAVAPEGVPFLERPFVFVGRFVAKKCVPFLVDAFARYVELSNEPPRRLILIGSGETERHVRERVAFHGLHELVEITGFLQAEGIAQALASGVALILPSEQEQWGLVVNEALAFHLPLIVSENVGSRDMLVRNLVNGYVVERGSTEGFARAMVALGSNESVWRQMVTASAQFASFAHSDRFADAVEAMLAHPF